MTDLEISKALALAIGWDRDRMTLNTGVVRCYYPKQMAYDSSWRTFDYRDWNVIGPIAERYRLKVNFRDNIAFLPDVIHGTWADTPQKAIALAVIGAKT